jgi:two-component system, cell cycle sensor histidine kinase and response regulator CckA
VVNTSRVLKKIDPKVRVLLVSGYSLNKQIEELIGLGCKGYIQKPFDIVQLSQKIREVLDAPEKMHAVSQMTRA